MTLIATIVHVVDEDFAFLSAFVVLIAQKCFRAAPVNQRNSASPSNALAIRVKINAFLEFVWGAFQLVPILNETVAKMIRY